MESILQQGSQGEKVIVLQQSLNNAMSADLVIDGIFGFNTKVAVQWFQKMRNLSVDGIAGPQTWNALINSQLTDDA